MTSGNGHSANRATVIQAKSRDGDRPSANRGRFFHCSLNMINMHKYI
jgi:hypothetical protein